MYCMSKLQKFAFKFVFSSIFWCSRSALARAPKQLETIISHLEFAASTEADEDAIHKYNEIAGLLARATVLFEDIVPAQDETASAGGAKGAPNLQALFGSVDLTKIVGGFAAGGNSDVMMNMAQMMMLTNNF